MKVVFLGTGEFAVPSLRAVHAAGHTITLVVSQPDRPKGRGLELKPTPVKSAALALGIEVFQPEKLRNEPDPVIAQNPRACGPRRAVHRVGHQEMSAVSGVGGAFQFPATAND